MTTATYAPTDATRWTMPAVHPHTIARARHWTRQQLTKAELPDTAIDNAELIISELLTNVLLHAPGEAEITLHLEQDLLTITCADRGPFPLATHPHGEEDETGRGLQLVTALCADRIFTRRRLGGGKRIYALLAIGTRP